MHFPSSYQLEDDVREENGLSHLDDSPFGSFTILCSFPRCAAERLVVWTGKAGMLARCHTAPFELCDRLFGVSPLRYSFHGNFGFGLDYCSCWSAGGDESLYRIRRLLTKTDEQLTDAGRDRLVGLLAAGDPRGDVLMTWHAKEVVRQIYSHADPELADEFVTRLGHDVQDISCPTEVHSLGRNIVRWKAQIAAWHRGHVSNGPTEAANNLIKRVKRVAFGFRQFRNSRIRVLLYAGRPNWELLATITPRRNPKCHYGSACRQEYGHPVLTCLARFDEKSNEFDCPPCIDLADNT